MKKAVYWFEATPPSVSSPLLGDLEADAVVVGGGMAGLTAAQWLREEAGLDVVLLEAQFCGAGATGVSSGLINVDTELDAWPLSRRFGIETARFLMDSAMSAVQHIRQTVDRYGIECGFIEADALYVADRRLAVPEVRLEHRSRRELGLESRYYGGDAIATVIGSDHFRGAVRYSGTFGMSGLGYAQGLRDALRETGVRVYENTPVQRVEPGRVVTLGGSVRARYVLVCVDRAAPILQVRPTDVYHQQSFITVSEPLPEEVRTALFPDGPLLVYDARLLFHYFRLTPDGRLVLGGGMHRNAYHRRPADPGPAGTHLTR